MRRLPIKNEPWVGSCSVLRALGPPTRQVPFFVIAVSIALAGAIGSFPARGVAQTALEEAPIRGQEGGKQAGKEANQQAPKLVPKETAGSAVEPRPNALPPGVVARINGRDVSIEEYASYLFATLGKSKLDDYIDRLLIDEEAQRQGLTIAPEQVESALEQRIERTVKSFYKGERQQFLDNLTRRRTTLPEYKARWRQRMYFDMLVEEMVIRTREVTPQALQKEFTRSYGDGGIQLVLRHILVSKRVRTSEGPVRSDSEARARAAQILGELEGGLDFAQAVKQYSDDTFTKRNEGRIVHYRKGFYGDEFHRAVNSLTAEQPRSGVVASTRGYHLVELIERRATKFEDVKVELEAFFKTRPPTVEEKHALTARLREKAEIEGLD